MFIDKNGKLFSKVSIVDLIIIVIIFVVTFAAVYKFGKEEISGASEEDDLLIQLYQEEVPDFVAKSIKEGDIAIEDVQSAVFGNVKEIIIGKSVSWAQSEKGEYVASTKEGYSSISITLSGKGKLSGKGVKIGTGTYFIGKNLTIKIANSIINPRISEIKLANQAS